MKKNVRKILVSFTVLLLCMSMLFSCNVTQDHSDPVDSTLPSDTTTVGDVTESNDTELTDFETTTAEDVFAESVPDGILLAGKDVAKKCTVFYPAGDADLESVAKELRELGVQAPIYLCAPSLENCVPEPSDSIFHLQKPYRLEDLYICMEIFKYI